MITTIAIFAVGVFLFSLVFKIFFKLLKMIFKLIGGILMLPFIIIGLILLLPILILVLGIRLIVELIPVALVGGAVYLIYRAISKEDIKYWYK